jgi:UDP-N-acetylenolpyruvoylglucosamine reductase
MEEVRAAVHHAFDVLLETEVRLIGFPQPSISAGGSP